MQIRDYLQMHVDMMERTRGGRKPPEGVVYPGGPYEIVLKYGRTFGPHATTRFRHGRMKQCFKNAAQLMMSRPDLHYCEGFALAAGILPTLHAWCCDDEGRIYDPTWDSKDHPPSEYLGVVFDREFVTNRVLENGYYGLFSDDMFYDVKMMRGDFKTAELPAHAES